MPIKYHYFPLWAKGPTSALALTFSGLDWEGGIDFGKTDVPPDAEDGWVQGYVKGWLGGARDYPVAKNTTPWGELPVIETEIGVIGQESAILNYIARKAPAMGGADDKEFAVSQQLIFACEDIYNKLARWQPTMLDKKEALATERAKFWGATHRTGSPS